MRILLALACLVAFAQSARADLVKDPEQYTQEQLIVQLSKKIKRYQRILSDRVKDPLYAHDRGFKSDTDRLEKELHGLCDELHRITEPTGFRYDKYHDMLERYCRKSENFRFYVENVCDVENDQQFQQAIDLYCDLARDYNAMHEYARGK